MDVMIALKKPLIEYCKYHIIKYQRISSDSQKIL